MITTFYSYKGGVGRSLALLHVAWRVAALRPNLRILVVDLDLEAPSLDGSFLPTGAAPRGFAGLIVEAAAVSEATLAAWMRERLTEEGPGFVSVGGPEGKRPNLTYLPSGLGPQAPADAPTYPQVTQRLRAELTRVESDPPRLPQEGFLGAFRETLATAFDYVFIDSRTGLADEAWLNTVLLPDALVLFFRLDLASLGGMPEVLGNYLNRADINTISTDPTIKVIPVLGMAPARGGPDIPDWIDQHANWLITREKPEGLEQRRDAPLSRRSSLFRIPRDPWFEVDNPKIVNNEGEWIRGFDDGEPVSVGLQGLTEAILSLNYVCDTVSAAELVGIAIDEDEESLALAYYKCWVENDPRECDKPPLVLLGDEVEAWRELRPQYLRHTASDHHEHAAVSAIALARHEPTSDHHRWLQFAMDRASDNPPIAMKALRTAKFDLPLLTGALVRSMLATISPHLKNRPDWIRRDEEAWVQLATRTGQVAMQAAVMRRSENPFLQGLGKLIVSYDLSQVDPALFPFFGQGDGPVIRLVEQRILTMENIQEFLRRGLPTPERTGYQAAAILSWGLLMTGHPVGGYQDRIEPRIGATWITLRRWLQSDPASNEAPLLNEPTIDQVTDHWLLPHLANTAFHAYPFNRGGAILDTLADLFRQSPTFAQALPGELASARLTLETLAARGRFPAENLIPLQPLWDWADTLPDPQPIPPWDPKDGLPVDDMVATWEILCRLCARPSTC